MKKILFVLCLIFSYSSLLAQAPANDFCINAITLTPGVSCTATAGTNLGVDDTDYDNCDFSKYNVWYRFTASASSQIIRVTRGSIQNIFIDVYEDNCDNFDRVSSCKNTSNTAIVEQVVSGLTKDSTYLIAISTLNISEQGTFDICVLSPQAPANDDCTNAVALPVNTANVPIQKTSGTTLFANQSLAGCVGTADDDVWYSFTATQNSHRVFLQKIGMTDNAVVELFSGNCQTLVNKQCISSGFSSSVNSSAKLTSLNIGETYFLRVYTSGTPGAGSFEIAITSAPTNDECTTAISLNVATNEAFSNAVAASSFDATLSPNGNSLADDDVWFSFVATQKIHKIKIKEWDSNKAIAELFSGTCNSLVAVNCGSGCNNSSQSGDTLIFTHDNFVAGQTYFFKAYSNHATIFQSLFQVAVSSPFVSPYDECVNALDIPTSNNSTCTTTSFNLNGAFNSNTGFFCNFSTNPKDVFLKFTASAIQHQIKITPTGLVNGQLFKGNCGSLTLEGCGAFGFDSLASFGGLVIGQTYTLRLLSGIVNVPNLSICISSPNFATNDEITGATSLDVSTDQSFCSPKNGSLLNTSQSKFSSCNTSGSSTNKLYFDVWYKFVASSASQGIYLLNTSTNTLKFELYNGSISNPNYITCSADITTSSNNANSNFILGETYYIRVFSNVSSNVNFKICIYNLAQPPNNICNNAKNLAVFSTWNSINYTLGSTKGAIQTIGSNTCGAANSYDVWYKFTATQSSHQIAFRNSFLQPAISGLTVAVFSGNCSTLIPISCKTGSFTASSEDYLLLNSLTIGTEYTVKVYSSTSVVSSQGGFEIQVLGLNTPVNDNCSNPINLIIQNSAVNFSFTSFHNVLATQSSEAIACTVAGTADDDIWFSFTPTGTSVRLILSTTFTEPVFVLYSGTCGALTPISCGKAATGIFKINKILNGLAAGVTYTLRIYSSSNISRGRAAIALSSDALPPPNDLCINAATLTPSSNNDPIFADGSTVSATNTNLQCFGGNEVWYKFVATSTSHRVIYDGFIKDPAIVMFQGTCGSFTIIPGTCFTNTHSISFTKTDLIIGQTYYIKVAAQVNEVENQGNFKIAVVTASIPPNDNCANAISLSNSYKFYSASLATNEFATSSICGFNLKDVWFKFTATKAKMNVLLENLNTNAILGLYQGTCPSPTLIKCTFENSSQKFSWKVNTLILDDLVIGQEYLVNVAASVASAALDFKIKIEEAVDITENTIINGACLNQNLVSNPSFEDPETCPTNFVGTPASPGQWLSPNLGWTIPSMGSADYFNSCAAYNSAIEVPRNPFFGVQNPRNGIAFAGFFVGGSQYREYLHTELSEAMVVGKRYLLSMFVSRADFYPFATNNIGFGLSLESKIKFDFDSLMVDKTILPTNNQVITEKDNWVNISVDFTADQAYRHLYLGNFKGNLNSITQLTDDISGGESGGYAGTTTNNAYYFVDDVLVSEIQNTIACGANNCNSILVLSSPSDDISGGTSTKSTNLEIKANILIDGNANVLFKSGKSILMDGLQGVFEAKKGVVFETKIEGCNN